MSGVVFYTIAVLCFGIAIGSMGLAWLLWRGINSRPKDARCEPFVLEKVGAVLERVHGVRMLE